MQRVYIVAGLILLVAVLYFFGIEPALAFAVALTAVVWFGYRLTKGKPENLADLPEAVEFARSLLPIFLIVLLLRAFTVEPFRIPSGSMMPTLLSGDFILVNKFAYGIRLPVTKTKIIDIGEPERGDVMVFRYPEDPKVDYIKRVIGLPGDKISYSNKTLTINGEPVKIQPIGRYKPEGLGIRDLAPFRPNSKGEVPHFEGIEALPGADHHVLVNPMVPDLSPRCNFIRGREITVPEGHYFMMGDNRDHSWDGRCWGFVPEENIVGKAMIIWFSWDTERSGIVGWNRIGNAAH